MIIREGEVEIETTNTFERGPGKRSSGFYNRVMELSRDFTIAILKVSKPGLALDGMASTGIRGLRIKKETGWNVVLNDKDRRNKEIMSRNAQLNKLEPEIQYSDFLCAVSTRKWDYIDLDPFGSPAGFVEGAVAGLKNNGILGISMTDTANLEGNSIAKGQRIYGSRSLKGIFSRELSTRIFAKYVLERGASLNMAGKVLLSLRQGHYIRLFIQFKRGNNRSDQVLSSLTSKLIRGRKIGPLYVGPLYDKKILEKIGAINLSEQTARIFGNFQYEDLMFLFKTNEFQRREIRISRIIESIRNSGGVAGRTNFNEKGIKTNLTEPEYQKILSSL